MVMGLKAGVVVGVVGGAAAGLGVGLAWLDKIDAAAAATIVGSGLGAALSVWGAFAVATHQSNLQSALFSELAVEVAKNMQAEARKTLGILDRAADQQKLNPENADKVELVDEWIGEKLYDQIVRLVESIQVFTEQIGNGGVGRLSLRLAILGLRGAMGDCADFVDKNLEKDLQKRMSEEKALRD